MRAGESADIARFAETVSGLMGSDMSENVAKQETLDGLQALLWNFDKPGGAISFADPMITVM